MSKAEILQSKSGVTLSRTVEADGSAAGREIFTVASKWGAAIQSFDVRAEAEAWFDAQVALAPKRPSLYGERYKET